MRLRVRPMGLAASVEAVIPSWRGHVLFLLGGPVANLVLGLVLLWVGGEAALLGTLSIVFFAMTLSPWGNTDGNDLLALLRSRRYNS